MYFDPAIHQEGVALVRGCQPGSFDRQRHPATSAVERGGDVPVEDAAAVVSAFATVEVQELSEKRRPEIFDRGRVVGAEEVVRGAGILAAEPSGLLE